MSAQTIAFRKMHGAGNDFILIDDRDASFPVGEHDWIAAVCARRTGVGAEGLILVQPAEQADFRMRFFNPDGSEVEMCGNGARCVARFAHEAGIGDLAHRDLHDEGAAAREDLHQPGLGELDEGLAHRLAADAEAPGDLLLRQRLAGPKLAGDDRLAQGRDELRRDRIAKPELDVHERNSLGQPCRYYTGMVA